MTDPVSRPMGYAGGIVGVLSESVSADMDRTGLAPQLHPIGHWLPDLDDLVLDLEPLRHLVHHMCNSFGLPGASLDDAAKNALDAWIAPRLHYALRVPRRLASLTEFWSWIALEHARPVVVARFGDADRKVARWRFTGTALRNAISRLWWAAEMGRNGPDYSSVPHIFGRTRTAQFALELAYSQYRPAAIAFATVAEGQDGKQRLPDAEVKRLSTVVNALLSLRVLEACDEGSDDATELDEDWWTGTPDLDRITASGLPPGPSDGYASPAATTALAKWFRALASTSDVAAVPMQCGPAALDESAESDFRAPPRTGQQSPGSRRSGDPSGARAGSLGPRGDEGRPLPAKVDENDRYVELPLPADWQPILAEYAPGDAPQLATIPADTSRVREVLLSDELPARLRSILLRRLLGGRTLEEVGSTFGLTRERVRQLQKRALKTCHVLLSRSLPVANDLVELLIGLPDDGLLVVEDRPWNRFVVALVRDLAATSDLEHRRSDGRLIVHRLHFSDLLARIEADVLSRREFVSPGYLADVHGVPVEVVDATVGVSDHLYLDRAGRVGTDAWSKKEMLEVVAWILALSEVEAVQWHASELVQAAKVVFPHHFAEWRARHAMATMSRADVTAFAHVGRRGRWALAEAVHGPGSTTEAIVDLLALAPAPVHVDKIELHLSEQGRDVSRHTLEAILYRNEYFVGDGHGHYALDGEYRR